MTEPTSSDLKDRLAKAQEIRREREGISKETEERYKSISGAGQAMTFAAELVAPMVVGLAIGIGLDLWFKTSPLFLLLMFCFGLAAGVMGVIRAYRTFNAELEAQAKAESNGQTDGIDTP